MKKVPVYAVAGASFYIGEVEIESPEDFNDAAEKLWRSKDYDSPTLCLQCSDIDIGDFEIDNTHIDYYFEDAE